MRQIKNGTDVWPTLRRHTTNDNSFTIFVLGQVLVLPAAVAAKRFAAFLMKKNIWIPLRVGIALLLLAAVVMFLLPSDDRTRGTLEPQRRSREDDQRVQERSQDTPLAEQDWYIHLFKRIKKGTLGVILLSSGVSFLIGTYLVTGTFGQLMSGTVFLQFVEGQLHIDFSDVRDQPEYLF
jgi:hypothetical protein